MGQAAYQKLVQVSDDAGVTWHTLPTTSPSLSFGADVLDATTTETAGWRERILGLETWSIQADSNYAENNDALTKVRTALLNRTSTLIARYLPKVANKAAPSNAELQNGFMGDVVVERFDLSGDTSGLETVGITLQSNGALAAAA